MDTAALAVIADPATPIDELKAAIGSLGPPNEPSAFWAGIANNGEHSDDHRRHAIFALLARHAHPPLPVSALAELLAGAPWLADDDLTLMTRLGGKVPVQWRQEDSIVVLRVFPALAAPPVGPWAVYLRVAGKHAEADLRAALRGEPAPASAREAQVVELALVPRQPAP